MTIVHGIQLGKSSDSKSYPRQCFILFYSYSLYLITVLSKIDQVKMPNMVKNLLYVLLLSLL